jgi:hypothetical protein
MSRRPQTVSAPASLLDAFVSCYTPETLAAVARARLSAAGQARVDMLAAKANDGTLSPAERQEYRAFIKFADVLALLHLKARVRLGLPLPQAEVRRNAVAPRSRKKKGQEN